MERYQFKLCARKEIFRNTSLVGQRRQDGIGQLTFSRIRMRIWIQFVLYIRQPEHPMGIEDILAQRRKEFLEHTALYENKDKGQKGEKSQEDKKRET